MARIMMIDDEPETLEIYKCYLQNDFVLFPYHTGAEALRDVQEVHPDLILLDIEMPYMDGFKVLEYLKSSGELSQIPVIGVTGQRSKTVALKFLGKGAAAYVTKPVSRDDLRNKIREVYDKEQEKRNKKKILIVDDEIVSLLYYKTLLSEEYNVMGLSSGKAALDYLCKVVPDLIILDYQMPLFTGKQLLQIIRTMEKVKHVPVVFLTGTSDKEIILACAEVDVEGVLSKKQKKEELLLRIEEIMNKERE